MELLKEFQPIITLIGSIISLGVLGFILKLSNQIKELYKQRLEAAKEKASITEERLRLAEEELKRVCKNIIFLEYSDGNQGHLNESYEVIN